MKILYGVQGTGNGHISRASAMMEAFKSYPDLDVTWLLSGREKDKGCGAIQEYMWREGLTFVTESGKVNIMKTLVRNNVRRFFSDVDRLNVNDYDLLICDFEPVLAHAARKRGLPLIGIGHQYAFNYPIPVAGANPVSSLIMRKYAPVNTAVGLHWHHFDNPILPPIIDLQLPDSLPVTQHEKVVVYLPFESPSDIHRCLEPFSDFEFYIYHPDSNDLELGHLHFRSISREGFKRDLLDAARVISNSGFELISECLQLGKAIFSKPLSGQLEQHSNALALDQLGYAEIFEKMKPEAFRDWLFSPCKAVQITYPDVAAALARWINQGCSAKVEDMAIDLWSHIDTGTDKHGNSILPAEIA